MAVEDELELAVVVVVTEEDSALTSGIIGITLLLLLFEAEFRLNVNGVPSCV